MRIAELFCGLKGWSAPAEERGHEVWTTDIDPRFSPDLAIDVLELKPSDLPWRPDVVLASPPCEAFSVLRIGHNWTGPDDDPPHAPKTDAARLGIRILERTLELIAELEPAYWIVENPVGKMRRMPVLEPFYRRTVTYCAYGAPWRKPTDLWGAFPPSLELRPRCRPGDPCHVPAPRGSTQGIQSDTSSKDPRVRAWFDKLGPELLYQRPGEGRRTAHKRQARALMGTSDQRQVSALRAKIPPELAMDVTLACERDHGSPDRSPLGQLRMGQTG